MIFSPPTPTWYWYCHALLLCVSFELTKSGNNSGYGKSKNNRLKRNVFMFQY